MLQASPDGLTGFSRRCPECHATWRGYTPNGGRLVRFEMLGRRVNCATCDWWAAEVNRRARRRVFPENLAGRYG